MKCLRIILACSICLFLIGSGEYSHLAEAQGGKPSKEDFLLRDAESEQRAAHNVEVAEFYLKRKKYKASINRLEEIAEIYEQYTRIDKVYFLLGESYRGQGDIELAKAYYQKILDKFPESEFFKSAQKQLDKLKSTRN